MVVDFFDEGRSVIVVACMFFLRIFFVGECVFFVCGEVVCGRGSGIEFGSWEFLNFFDEEFVVGKCEGEGVAIFSGTSGSPDAVNVVFWVFRDIDIEDMAYIGDIDSPCDDIGADEEAYESVAKFLHTFKTDVLAHVAVEDSGGNFAILEFFSDFVDISFSVAEDEGSRDVFWIEELYEGRDFF